MKRFFSIKDALKNPAFTIGILCAVALAVLALSSVSHANTADLGKSGTIKSSEKTGSGSSSDYSTSRDRSESLNRNIDKTLSTVRNRKLSATTKQSLSKIREKSKSLTLQRSRNFVADLMLIAFEELRAAAPEAVATFWHENTEMQDFIDSTLTILVGADPARYGISPLSFAGLWPEDKKGQEAAKQRMETIDAVNMQWEVDKLWIMTQPTARAQNAEAKRRGRSGPGLKQLGQLESWKMSVFGEALNYLVNSNAAWNQPYFKPTPEGLAQTLGMTNPGSDHSFQYRQHAAGSGVNFGGNLWFRPMKKDMRAGYRLAAVLADCLNDVSDDSLAEADLLESARAWMKARAVDILTCRYKPRTNAYRKLWEGTKDLGPGDMRFNGGAKKHLIGPISVDMGSAGFFAMTVSGFKILTPDAVNNTSTTLSFSTGYTMREQLSDMKDIAQIKDLTTAVTDKVQYLRSIGETKKASMTARLYRDTMLSMTRDTDQNAKFSVLQSLSK